MQLILSGPLSDESELPTLTEDDAGRTYWIDLTWFIWSGTYWQKAIATTTKPEEAKPAPLDDALLAWRKFSAPRWRESYSYQSYREPIDWQKAKLSLPRSEPKALQAPAPVEPKKMVKPEKALHMTKDQRRRTKHMSKNQRRKVLRHEAKGASND